MGRKTYISSDKILRLDTRSLGYGYERKTLRVTESLQNEVQNKAIRINRIKTKIDNSQ